MLVKKMSVSTTSPAFMQTYLLDNTVEINQQRKRPLLMICPGGGYEFTSDREAEPIAMQALAKGYHACVLRYSLSPKAHFPESLLELATAVSLVRENAEEWHVDTDKIIVTGFSAGGHLAASLGVFWNKTWFRNLLDKPGLAQPNGLLLAYPVISNGEYGHQNSFKALLGADYNNPEKRFLTSLENQVDEQTPRTFIWHTGADETVPMENSLLFAQKLRANQVPFSLHIFLNGGHGLSLAVKETESRYGNGVQSEVAQWFNLFDQWVKTNF